MSLGLFQNHEMCWWGRFWVFGVGIDGARFNWRAEPACICQSRSFGSIGVPKQELGNEFNWYNLSPLPEEEGDFGVVYQCAKFGGRGPPYDPDR